MSPDVTVWRSSDETSSSGGGHASEVRAPRRDRVALFSDDCMSVKAVKQRCSNVTVTVVVFVCQLFTFPSHPRTHLFMIMDSFCFLFSLSHDEESLGGTLSIGPVSHRAGPEPGRMGTTVPGRDLTSSSFLHLDV